MLLLDTQIALWRSTGDAQLKNSTRKRLAATRCANSVVSVWEVAIKHQLGKLGVEPGVCLNGMQEGPATILQDPFDLMLRSVAVDESTSFLTADMKLADYAELHTALIVARA